MDRLTYSTARPKHLEQNLNSSDGDTGSNKPTSTSQNKTTPPTLRNVVEINGRIIYPSIQLNEHKNSIIRHDDNSSIVESSGSDDEDSSSIVESYSDEEDNGGFKKASSEITLSSRPSSTQKKNSVTAFEVQSTSFFEHMPEDVIRKILFENFIDLKDISITAKNLMHFASISKFNREFVRQLLTEEEMHEVSFEITKLVIPNLLSTLANDINAEFSQEDIDRLVGNYPYLTFDSSYGINKKNFTIKGNEALKQIVSHSGLKGLRIINNLPEIVFEWEDAYQACNNNGLELIGSLLSRKNSNPIKVDFEFKNWMPPLDSKYEIKEKIFDLIQEIQKNEDSYSGVTFGEINLSRTHRIGECYLFQRDDPMSLQCIDYQFKFVTMMCNIALTHSAQKISLSGLNILEFQLEYIIDEIKKCDKQTLKHLDLSINNIVRAPAEGLNRLLQSENTCLETLKLNHSNMNEDALHFISKALENNSSLESIEMPDHHLLNLYSAIKNDKRVKITEAELTW